MRRHSMRRIHGQRNDTQRRLGMRRADCLALKTAISLTAVYPSLKLIPLGRARQNRRRLGSKRLSAYQRARDGHLRRCTNQGRSPAGHPPQHAAQKAEKILAGEVRRVASGPSPLVSAHHLLVAVNGKPVFEGSQYDWAFRQDVNIPRRNHPAWPCLKARAGFAAGPWVDLGGDPLQLDVWFGESGENLPSAILLVQPGC